MFCPRDCSAVARWPGLWERESCHEVCCLRVQGVSPRHARVVPPHLERSRWGFTVLPAGLQSQSLRKLRLLAEKWLGPVPPCRSAAPTADGHACCLAGDAIFGCSRRSVAMRKATAEGCRGLRRAARTARPPRSAQPPVRRRSHGQAGADIVREAPPSGWPRHPQRPPAERRPGSADHAWHWGACGPGNTHFFSDDHRGYLLDAFFALGYLWRCKTRRFRNDDRRLAAFSP